MDNVFDLYVVNRDQPFRTAMLTLPASIYEMVDIAEQVGSEKVEELYFKVEERYRGECLVNALGRDITIPKLNILAWKVAEMDEEQEAILEGLIKMEQKKQDVPWLPYPKLLQLAENTACCHRVPQARNDSQLGRFYAENGFVEGVDDLPDRLFELLSSISRRSFTDNASIVLNCSKVRRTNLSSTSDNLSFNAGTNTKFPRR